MASRSCATDRSSGSHRSPELHVCDDEYLRLAPGVRYTVTMLGINSHGDRFLHTAVRNLLVVTIVLITLPVSTAAIDAGDFDIIDTENDDFDVHLHPNDTATNRSGVVHHTSHEVNVSDFAVSGADVASEGRTLGDMYNITLEYDYYTGDNNSASRSPGTVWIALNDSGTERLVFQARDESSTGWTTRNVAEEVINANAVNWTLYNTSASSNATDINDSLTDLYGNSSDLLSVAAGRGNPVNQTGYVDMNYDNLTIGNQTYNFTLPKQFVVDAAGDRGNFKQIQSAAEESRADNETVTVVSSTYTENVSINQSMGFTNEGDVNINGTFSLNTLNITVEGFNFIGDGTAVNVTTDGTDTSIRQNDFLTDVGVAIYSNDTVNATDNFWNASSGPNGAGADINEVNGTVNYRPWLLTEDGTTYDQTVALTATDEWTLLSAPRLLDEKPTVETDDGQSADLLTYSDGGWVSGGSSTFEEEVKRPVGAFYARASDRAGIGFSYKTNNQPSETAQPLTKGWNLIGTNREQHVTDALSSLQVYDHSAGITTLFQRDTYNARKDFGHNAWNLGSPEKNADPISGLPDKNMTAYDGYWVYASGSTTYSKLTE